MPDPRLKDCRSLGLRQREVLSAGLQVFSVDLIPLLRNGVIPDLLHSVFNKHVKAMGIIVDVSPYHLALSPEHLALYFIISNLSALTDTKAAASSRRGIVTGFYRTCALPITSKQCTLSLVSTRLG